MTDFTTAELSSPIDGVPLHVRTWAATGDLRGVLVIVHGLGEHGGRYDALAGAFAETGWAVVAADHRGHGRSGGLRGHVDGFDQYVSDVAAVVRDARARLGSVPVALWGHSMGGLIGLITALDVADLDLSAIAISNPLLEVAVKAPKIKLIGGRVLSRVLPRLRLDNELKVQQISRDPEEVSKYQNDPLVHRLISTRWFTSMEAARIATGARAAELSLPTLVLIGTGDQICAPAAGIAFANACPAATLTTFEGAYHEPHNDLCRDDVRSALLTWLDKVAADVAETMRYEASAPTEPTQDT